MKNNFFKLFLLAFILIMFFIPLSAKAQSVNALSKIFVNRLDRNIYGINLFFNSKYDNNAFVQQKDTGSYYVFIPDTQMNSKHISVIYKYGSDKSNIKINVEEKPFYKEDVKSSYIRLTVDVAPDYSIKILSNTMDNFPMAVSSPFFNFSSFLALMLIGAAIYILVRVLKVSGMSKSSDSYTAFPAGYIKYEDNNSLTIPKDFNSAMSLPKFNLKKTIKTADAKDFSCFDIPDANGSSKPFSAYKTLLKQTSETMKEKTLKEKHTSPISVSKTNSDSELDLPVVEDIIDTKTNQTEEKAEPELLSVLNLGPNKGFYLTTVEDAFGLFGFVNDKIFLLKKFNDLSQINLQARYYDRNFDKDVYIVRMDSYKAMVEVSETGMQELAVL